MITTAKLFRNGRSQALRLPRVQVRGRPRSGSPAGRGVLVEPMFGDVAEWFAELDRCGPEPFMADSRRQPPTLERELFQ